MKNDLKTKIHEALASAGADGMVGDVQVSGAGEVVFTIEVDPAMGAGMEPLRMAAEEAVRKVSGVKCVTAILTAERQAAAPDPHGMNKSPRLELPFRHVIAVGSGKGGVGKSTVAFNVAAELAAMGFEVALLDADIYGPSVPRLAGLSGRKAEIVDDRSSPPSNPPARGGRKDGAENPPPPAGGQGGERGQGKIRPLEAYGMKVMSMGFLVEEEKPMIWRGPMVQTAFYQMLRDVAWRNGDGLSDYLIIDMPPGTGDVQLTLAQKVPVSGAVIVSTPQDLALIDARKAIAMFEKTGVSILGLIENMSSYCCPNCGHVENVFGHGGAREEASKRGVPFLGEVPLNAKIRGDSDAGIKSSDPSYKSVAVALIQAQK